MGVNGIYGLSGSGMDIESMVKVGMMSKQNEYDKMAQKFTKNEWMKANYIELNSQITTFNASTLSQYKMSTNMNAKSAESTSSAVKVDAGSAAAVMSHKVQVLDVASNAYLVGTNNMTRYGDDKSSILLKDVLFAQLETNDAGNVYGKAAKMDLDGTETTRDNRTAPDDGVKVTSAYKFGYSDVTVAAHWEDSNGNTVSLTSRQVWDLYHNTSTTASAGEWRARGSNLSEPYWERSNGTSWVVTNPDTDTYKTEFKNWITTKNTQLAEAGTTGYTWVPTTTTATGTSVGLDKSTVAFKFTLSDGVTTDDSGALKTVDIEYTYAQLMDEGITFNDLVSKINNSGLNIRANYDSVHDLFSFYNTKTGEDNTINIAITDDSTYTGARAGLTTRNFFNNMGLYVSKGGDLYSSSETTDANKTDATEAKTILFNLKNSKSDGVNTFTGSNAEIKVDGVTYSNLSDNRVTVAGVTYTALEKMEETESATVSVTQDTDAIIDKVKSFVADYNKLLSSLYEKYDEKPNSDYKPLTQAQKDQMKEEQIEKWEEKAKAGLLYHDQTIGKIIQKMRSAITDGVELEGGSTVSVFSLGISTTGLKGQLVLDEDKLKKALATDSDVVYNVFAKLDSNNLDDYDKSGVAQRLGDIFVEANKSIKSRAGSTSDITEDSDLNNLLRNLQTKMSNFKKLMNSFEDALYKKYDAMESTLARLGTQLNFIMGGNA